MAKKQEKILEIHGDQRIDPYYWMNERDSADILDFLNSENEKVRQTLSPTEKLQEQLFQEMKSRIKEDDSSVPVQIDDYFYYSRFEQGKEYPIHCRKYQSLEAKEEVFLDVNELAQPHDFYAITGPYISADHQRIAFGVDTKGRRIYTIHFKDLVNGTILSHTIPNTTGNLAWSNDNNILFYTKQDLDTLRANEVIRHNINSQSGESVLFEPDETFDVYVEKSKSRKYVFVHSMSTLTSEVHFVPADSPEQTLQVFEPRQRGHEYSIDHGGDRFYILTNDGAKNFRVMETGETETERSLWREVVAHRSDVLIEHMEPFADFLVLEERKGGLTQIQILPRNPNAEATYLDYPDPAYVVEIGHNPMYTSKWLRFNYESLNQPPTVFDFHMESKEHILKKQKQVPGFDPSLYESDRLMATSHDGTQIPISIVYKKGLIKDGKNPLLQYGYGSYGASMEPWFSSNIYSLIDRGFIYAMAHIRGGSEMGRYWYEDGKLLKKKNTFTDYIACSEFLIQEGYTSPNHLYAMGGSAGGLLMGAVINMRPDLYNGVVAQVPFVDVVTTMLDESIPLTTGEFDEWGNPKDPAYYEYIKSYSPYDNIKAQVYPHLLVTTGYHDSQVQYWEPAKWVAKLQDVKTDRNLLLFHTDMESGHSGTTGRFKRLKEFAMEYAFILMLEGGHEKDA